ncbi:MAG: DNA-binding protein [Candidatus Saccharimonadales bacterium]
MDTITVVLIIAVFALLVQNGRLANSAMSAPTSKPIKASLADRATRVRSASRQRLENGTVRLTTTTRKISWPPLVAGLVIFGLVAMNTIQFVHISDLQQEMENILAGEVDQEDLASVESTEVSVPDELQDRIDRLSAQLNELSSANAESEAELAALREQNDELAAQLAEQAEEQDASPPATQTSAIGSSESVECPTAVATWFEEQRFATEDFRCGDFIDDPTERGDTSFSEKPISTHAELVEFLNSDSPEASAARAALRDSLSEADYQRALRGEGYLLTQVTVPAQYEANTYYRYKDGSAVFITTPRKVQAGDLLWVYTNTQGEVVESGNIRADCGNARAEKIVPQPDKPEQPKQPDQPDKPQQPDQPDQPDKPQQPEQPELKCFDEAGKPVFDGEFCAEEDSGPEEQDERDDEVDPTLGHDRGDAEETHKNQDEARKCIDSGICHELDPTKDDVEVPNSKDGGKAPGGGTDEPSDAADDNSEDDGTSHTTNPDKGTSDGDSDTPAQNNGRDPRGDPDEDTDYPNV